MAMGSPRPLGTTPHKVSMGCPISLPGIGSGSGLETALHVGRFVSSRWPWLMVATSCWRTPNGHGYGSFPPSRRCWIAPHLILCSMRANLVRFGRSPLVLCLGVSIFPNWVENVMPHMVFAVEPFNLTKCWPEQPPMENFGQPKLPRMHMSSATNLHRSCHNTSITCSSINLCGGASLSVTTGFEGEHVPSSWGGSPPLAFALAARLARRALELLS